MWIGNFARLTCLTLALTSVAALAGEGKKPGGTPLEFRSGLEPVYISGIATGQRPTLTDQTPEGVELPKFNDPVFGKWAIKGKPGEGVWVALDKSKTEGKYAKRDLLYIDFDGDGSLKDEEPIQAPDTTEEDQRVIETYERLQKQTAERSAKAQSGLLRLIRPLSVPLRSTFADVSMKMPGLKDADYTLDIMYYQYISVMEKQDEPENDETEKKMVHRVNTAQKHGMLYLRPTCDFAGEIAIGNKQYVCRVIDGNVDGEFFAPLPEGEKANGDCVVLLDAKGEKTLACSPQGGVLQAGDRMLRPKFQAKKKVLLLTRAQDVAVGKLVVDKRITAVTLAGPNGPLVVEPKSGEASLMAGTYRMSSWERVTTSGAGDTLTIKGARSIRNIKIEDGEETAPGVSLGDDKLIATLTCRKSGDAWQLNQVLKAADGSSISLLKNGERIPAPKVRIVNADKSYNESFSLEYG